MISKPNHLNLNGNILPASELIISPSNRSFCYGDALFETMHAYQEKVQFFSNHFSRLISGMKIFSMNLPSWFSQQFLHEQIITLMKKNRLYKGVRVRLVVFRNDGGYYTPETNNISFLIETFPLDSVKYGIQQKGLYLGLYPDIKKPLNLLSSLKTANSLLYVMAGIYKKDNNFDDCIIINEKGNVAETISSNIFFVKSDVLFTPPLSDGCVAGIMREQIIQIADDINLKTEYKRSISPDFISQAEEVFTTNSVSGIQWILGYKDNRFFHDISASLLLKLNNSAFNSN